jgi:ribosome-binding ATPase YchF (GTP1/OBG family)
MWATWRCPIRGSTTLAEIAKSKQVIPTRMTFVDIAGLVKGASKGEGLGNQFLANIREVDAIAHVLRCFEDGDVTHVEGRVDPVADAETIETELMLADMESIEKRLQNIVRKVRGGDKEAVQQERLMKAALAMLEEGKPARTVEVDEDAKAWKPAAAADHQAGALRLQRGRGRGGDGQRAVGPRGRDGRRRGQCACRDLGPDRGRDQPARPDEEAADVPGGDGAGGAGLDRLIRAGYELLNLQTYFTVGPKEARAWTIRRARGAPGARA